MLLFDDLGDFFNQIPLGLIVMVCGSGLLLFGAFSWYAYFKPQRNKRRARANADLQDTDYEDMPPPVDRQTLSSMPNDPPTSTFDPMDMPDLDLLVDDLQDEPPVASKPADPISEPGFLAHPVQEIPSAPRPAPSQPITKGQKYRVTLNTGDLIFTEEIVSIMRDPRDGRLVVYHEGTGYRTLVNTPDVKKEFVAIMRELSEVVTQSDENPPQSALQMETIEEPEAVIEPIEEAPISSPPPKRTTPPPPIGPDGAMPGDMPSFRLDDTKIEPTSKGLFGRPKFDFAAVEELDLGARIEAYLQHKLNYSQEYRGRDIHVRTAPGGGVRIQVDDNFYDAVGDVADPEVRAFLSETIQEWQDRH